MPRHSDRAWCTAVLLAVTVSPLSAQATRDSAGVRIVENAAPAWKDGEQLQLSATPRVSIGSTTDSVYRFGRVRGVLRLANGKLLVADGRTRQLRLYNAQGVFETAHAIGGTTLDQRSNIELVQRLRGDSIAIGTRISTFALHAPSGEYARQINVSAPGQSRNARPLLTLALLANGHRVAVPLGDNPTPHARGARWSETFVPTMYDQNQAIVRELGPLPYLTFEQDSASPSPPWLSAIGVFAAGGDRFYAGFGDEYAIRIFESDGKLTSIIRRAWKPVPVTAADWETWVVEWSKLWVDAKGAEREREIQKVRASAYAETLPAFSEFLVDRLDRLWVRDAHWQDAIGAGSLNDLPAIPSRWSVFSARGQWLGEVTMPKDFQPYDIGADYVVGKLVRDGVTNIVEYGLSARAR